MVADPPAVPDLHGDLLRAHGLLGASADQCHGQTNGQVPGQIHGYLCYAKYYKLCVLTVHQMRGRGVGGR